MPNFAKGSHASAPERFCKYIHRYCNQTRLEGYDYCIRHILEDKNAPFRQCIFVNQPNKKRCTNAASKVEKNDRRENALCPFHAKKALMKIKISHARKKPPAEGPAAFLKLFEHYCTQPGHDSSYRKDAILSERQDITVCETSRPNNLEVIAASFAQGESIDERARIENVDDDSAWVEKSDDYLEHAGVFTHKEVVTIARDKILRLQQLYCDELKVIYRELKEKRRKFLVEMRNSAKSDNSEEFVPVQPGVDHKVLQSMGKYHQCDGAERVLRHKAQEKTTELVKPKSSSCSLERNGKKCNEPAIVMTKFCKRHILSDPNQILFKACGQGRNCRMPIIPLEEKAACSQHFYVAFSRPKADAQPLPVSDQFLEPEPMFHSMDDMVSLGLDAIVPGSLFGLDQFGEPGESTDTALSEDLLQIGLNPPADILSDSRKSDSE